MGTDVPVDLGRDEARRLARAELSDPHYDADPSVLERAIGWLLDKIGDVFDLASGASPGGWVGVVMLAALAALTWAVVRHRSGPLTRSGGRDRRVFAQPPRSAAEHRRAADGAAAAADFATAVIERFRAIVRSLEERDLLDVRRGRTVGEVVRETTQSLPASAAHLAASARIFAEVRYGGRAATSEDDRRLRDADQAIATARPTSDRPTR